MSQYKTRRQQQQQRRRRIFKMIFIGVLLIAFVTIIVLFYLPRSRTRIAVAKKDGVREKTRQVSAKAQAQINTRETIAVMQSPAAVHIDTFSQTQPVNNTSVATTHPAPASVTPSAVPETTKPATTLLPKKVVLTKAKMKDILNSILLEKTKANNFSHCIQLRRTIDCNVTNAFALANFLQSKGYTISGRLTVDRQLSGVAVSAGEDCIVLTIGKMQP